MTFEVFTAKGRKIDARPLVTVDRNTGLRVNKAGRLLLDGVQDVEVLFDSGTGEWALRPARSENSYRVTTRGPVCTIAVRSFVRHAELEVGSRWVMTPVTVDGTWMLRMIEGDDE